jgi:predicted ATPase
LHRRIAETLRDRFPTLAESEPEIVGHHFTQAGLAEAAAGWWGKAGDRAMNKSAHHVAIAHLEKALGLASALVDEPARRLLRLRLQTTYGYALFHTRGQTAPETIAAFARARALSADVEQPAEKISACWGMWAASFVHADLTTMLEVTEDLMREAQRLPGSLEAVLAHRMSGITFWFQGDYASAREHLEQAFATHDHERDRHLASRFGYCSGPTTALWLAQVLWPLGHVARATHMAEQGLRLASGAGVK